MIIAPSSHSRAPSRVPSPMSYVRIPDPPLPFAQASPNSSDFHIEHATRTPRRQHSLSMPLPTGYDGEMVYRDHVSQLLAAKNTVFSVSGRIPLDPSQLVLFFRTKSGITHSLDFPIDVDYNTPPALDVLIAACRPHQTSDLDSYAEQESLFFPPNLPLTTSLEIANHPILAAIRTTLFPTLPEGHYLTAVRDRLEVISSGGRMGPQSRTLRNDGRVATLSVTLPVRFRGGGMIVRSDSFDTEEKYYGRGGKTGDMEWLAFLTDCDYEVETVEKGCRVSVLYGVYLKSFGTGVGNAAEPLINPSDGLFDLLAPVLNMSRGRKIAFYLSYDYGVNPAEVLAESLVPHLKGGDSVLYHALKLYKLTPELRWTAGGYIWAVDQTVETLSEDVPQPGPSIYSPMVGYPITMGTPAMRPFGLPEADPVVNLRQRIEASGALPLQEVGITVLTDGGNLGKERVPFVSGSQLEKLCVNTLMVVYIP